MTNIVAYPYRRFLQGIAIVLLLLAASCSDKKPKPPVPLDKMQQVMLELQYAEIYSIGKYPDSLHKKFEKNPDTLAVLYRSVLAHHGLSPEAFREAAEWYQQHPPMLDSLYARVLSKANENQAEFEKTEAAKAKNEPKTDTALKPIDTSSRVGKIRDSLRANRRPAARDTIPDKK